MKKIIFIFIAMLSFGLNAQGLKKIAEREYKGMRYANAAAYFNTYVAKNPSDLAAKKMLADSFNKLKDTKNAEKVYGELYTANPEDTAVAYNYATVLLEEGKNAEAVKVFEGLKKYPNYSKVSNAYIKSLTKVHELYVDSSYVKLFNLNINSSNAEFSPVLYKDKVVFASSRTRNYGKVKVFGWNNTPYLSIVAVDTNKITKTPFVDSVNKKYDFVAINNQKHSDETVLVPNDTKTLGYYGDYVHNSFDKKLIDTAAATPFSSTVNTKYHDGPCVFTKDGNTMFFTRNNYKSGKRRKDKDKVTRLKLFYSQIENGVWSNPKEVPFNSNDYSTGHPALSQDDKTLYFVSDMPGGEGGTDLYKVSYNNGDFGKPENLGADINTPAKEMFPTVDAKGNLFFASKGHGGLGGFDMFVVNPEKPSKIKNLGYPLNSKNDDFGLTFKSPTAGLISTNRKTGGFDDDILAFDLKKPISIGKKIKVIAFDELTGDLLPDVAVENVILGVKENNLTDQNAEYLFDAEQSVAYNMALTKQDYFPVKTKAILPVEMDDDVYVFKVPMNKNIKPTLQAQVVDRETKVPLDSVHMVIKDQITHKVLFDGFTPDNGTIEKLLDDKKIKDVLSLSISLKKPGYLAKTVTMATKIEKPLVKVQEMLDLTLEKLQLGMDIAKVIEIKPIYFDLNKYVIRPDAAIELNKIVKVMQENPSIVIELGSHTDCRSSRAYNMTLSSNRAKASAAYIISKGIPKSRIYGKGYGESKLVNDCACEMPVKSTCSEGEHQQNRRTEFVIVKM